MQCVLLTAYLYQAKEADCSQDETGLRHVGVAIESDMLKSGYAALVTLQGCLVWITRR